MQYGQSGDDFTGRLIGEVTTNHVRIDGLKNVHTLTSRRSLTERRYGRVLILDLDSTLTDTRPWFASFILALTAQLADTLKLSAVEVNQAYADIARQTTLHEYAYAVESIASKLCAHRLSSFENIAFAAREFWHDFASYHKEIDLFPGVANTLQAVKDRDPNMKIIILTDSPDWVAIERLKLTGILPLVDGVVSIRSEAPRLRHFGYKELVRNTTNKLRTDSHNDRRLAINMSLPAVYCKPSSAGIELILNRLGFANPESVIICGDRETKEGMAAHNWRLSRAACGLKADAIHYVRALYGQADYHEPKYAHLAGQIDSLAITAIPEHLPCSISADIETFDGLLQVIDDLTAVSPLTLEQATRAIA